MPYQQTSKRTIRTRKTTSLEISDVVVAEVADQPAHTPRRKESEGFKLAGNEGLWGESKERAFVVCYF